MRKSIVNRKWLYFLLLVGFFAVPDAQAAYITGGNSQWLNNSSSIYYNLGNVGVGVSNPSARLQVNPGADIEGLRIITSNYSPFIIRNAADTSDLFRIDQNGNIFSLGALTGSNTYWLMNGSNLYASSTSWNVGIGVTNPAYKLDVSGDLQVRGKTYMNTSSGQGSGAHGISWYTPSFLTWYDYMSSSGGTFAPNGTAAPSDTVSGVTSWARRFNIENVSGYGWIFESGSNTTSSVPTVKFSINSNNGNIHGIGNAVFDGSMAIGTTTPANSIHINGGPDKGIRLTNSNSGYSYSLLNTIIGISNSGFSIYDNNAATTRLALPSSGNIGIGTTTVPDRLSVSGGNIRINDAAITSGTPKAAITKEYLDSAIDLLMPGVKRSYSSVNTDSGVDDWYSVAQINDSALTPVFFNVRGYAHSSVSFVVGKGYSASGNITILNHVSSCNSSYKCVKGVRLTDTGIVQLKLGGGANVSVSVSAMSSHTSAPTLYTTLDRETGTPTMIDTVDPLVNGMVRSYGPLYSASGNSWIAGNLGIGITNPASRLDIISPDGIADINQLKIGSVSTSYGTYTFKQRTTSGFASQYLTLDITNNAGTYLNTMVWNGGSVGINTTTPDAKLNVNGTFHVTGALNSVVLDRLSGTGNRVVMTDAAGSLFATTSSASMPSGTSGQTLRHDGSNWVANSTLYNNGTNVGIGTTTPTNPLHVYSNNPTGLLFERSAAQNSNIQYKNPNGSMFAGISPSANFAIGNSVDLSSAYFTVLNSNGNVGIGITNPTVKLDVRGNLRVGAGLSSNGPTTHIAISSTDLASTTGINFYVQDGTQNTRVWEYLDANNKVFYQGHSWSSGGDIAYSLANGDIYAMATGNVGVATATPDAKLNVNGTFHVTGALNSVVLDRLSGTGNRVVMADASGSLFATTSSASMPSGTSGQTLRHDGSNWVANSTLYNNGTNVGIGVTPVTKLDVNGNLSVRGDNIYIGSSNETTSQSAIIDGDVYPYPLRSKMVTDDSGYSFGWTHYNSTNATETHNMMLTVSGGRASLKVDRDISIGPLAGAMGAMPTQTIYAKLGGNNASDVSYFNAGNVGIGTTTPGQKLHVVGNIMASGSVTTGGGATVLSTGTYGQLYQSNGVALQFWNGSATINGLVVNNSGNVMVATTSNLARINVSGNVFINDAVITSTTTKAAITKEYLDSALSAVGNYWTQSGSNLYTATTTWNVGIGVTNPQAKLTLPNNQWLGSTDAAGTGIANMFRINTSNQIEVGSPLLIGPLELAQDGGSLTFIDMPVTAAAPNGTVEGYTMKLDGNNLLSLYSTSNGAGGVNNLGVGIGTTTPAAKLHVIGNAIISTGLTLGGPLNMGSQNITNINKLTVNTIDPLYNIKGINYSTYASAIVGGVNEEYVGRIKISRSVGSEYEAVIDFAKAKEGSDLWVWRKVIDFNAENVQALITPYKSFARVYYNIEGERLVFRSDRPVEVSYRLIGKRHDWRLWPTKAVDQQEKAGFIID